MCATFWNINNKLNVFQRSLSQLLYVVFMMQNIFFCIYFMDSCFIVLSHFYNCVVKNKNRYYLTWYFLYMYIFVNVFIQLIGACKETICQIKPNLRFVRDDMYCLFCQIVKISKRNQIFSELLHPQKNVTYWLTVSNRMLYCVFIVVVMISGFYLIESKYKIKSFWIHSIQNKIPLLYYSMKNLRLSNENFIHSSNE